MQIERVDEWVLRCATHVELLRTRSLHSPEKRAYTYLVDGEKKEEHLTYAELDRQARTIAALLQEEQAAGKPVLLLYQPGLEYLAGFFGCLYAGAIAVPAYPPRLNHNLERLEAIVADAQPVQALSSQAFATATMRKYLTASPRLAQLPLVVTDTLSEDMATRWREPALRGETLAFLQYTSGSTGKPKGVMVSHHNLLYNHRMFQVALQHADDAPFVSWLPLFHDLGLIGHALQSIYQGVPCVFMSPWAFLQKPLRWLQAISHYKAYTSYAPNFAYDLCIQKITPEQRATLDLSHWYNAGNAAEPIRNETLERFAETFASCGFRRESFLPGYGLAEATLVVATADSGKQVTTKIVRETELEQQNIVVAAPDEKRAHPLVSSGHTWLEQKIIIVDPDRRTPCPPGRIGEIWVSGEHIAQGYWKHPEETAETFQAHLADSGEGPFLRTGDLGFLDAGELFVTGRLKDLIIIYGQNYYPQDIELVADRSHPALRPNCNAAFSLECAGEERVILVQEIERQYRHQIPEEVFASIRQAILDAYELHIHGIVLIKPGSIPKTSSGKIQRRACRAALLARDLPIVAADMPASIADLIGYQNQERTDTPTVEDRTPTPSVDAGGAARIESIRPVEQAHEPMQRESPDASVEGKKMQFSLLYFSSDETELAENKYELLLEGARFADQHDFTAVWIPERHFHPFGGLYPNPSVLAAALAVTTKNIRVRAGSVVLPMHHPARVAEEWSVVDNLSAGRVDIAFATGWNPNDFALAPENYAQRKELMYADIEIFHKLWQGIPVTLPNGVGKQAEIKIFPRPRQRALTPWITCTGNPERFIEAGALGANVLTGLLFQSPEELAEKIKLYREARARHGHDPASGHVTLMLHTFIDEDIEEVRRKVRKPFMQYLESSVDLWKQERKQLDHLSPQERESVLAYAFERYFQTHALFGTPQSCEKKVSFLSEIGVDEIASLLDFGLDTDTVLDGLHWLNALRKRSQRKGSPRREHVAEELRGVQISARSVESSPASALNGKQSATQAPEVLQTPVAEEARPPREVPREQGQKQEPPSPLAHTLATMPQEQRVQQVQSYLQQQFARVLERRVDEMQGLSNIRALALDSLKVMSIVNDCQRDLQILPDAGRFYELTSIDELTLYLLEEYERVHAPGHGEQSVNLYPALRQQERQMRFPQSFAQQRMWFQQQFHHDSVVYNVPTVLSMKGHLHREALRRSLEEIVRRHEILRTTFDIHEGQPVQIVHSPAPFPLPIEDLSGYAAHTQEAQIQTRALQEAQQPFDLAHGPLIRATLLFLNPTEHMLLLTYHHIVADGWSRGIFLSELQALYTAFVAGQPSPLEELSLQYADFTVWQLDWLQSAAGEQKLLDTQLTYWKKQLSEPLPVLDLPIDHPRPPMQTFRGAHQSIHVPGSLIDELRALSKREGTTLFMTLLASFQILLARYSGQEDILVGCPIAGRTRPETEALIGLFLNTLALRADLSGNPSFREILQRVRKTCLEAYAHQDIPFERIVDAVLPARDPSRAPLFQVMFGLHDASWWFEAEVAGVSLRQVEMESGIAVFDLTWAMTTSGFGLIEYNADLFEESTIARMLAHWYEILRAIVANPLQRFAEIPLLTPAERAQLVEQGEASQHTESHHLCLHQLFEQQARQTPHTVAIQTPTLSLTYQEVDRCANQLARALKRLEIGDGMRVGVCMNRTPQAIIGLLAVLKARGIYVPLDPHYPRERLAFMVEDARIAALITQEAVRNSLPERELPTLFLESSWFQQTGESSEPLALEITPDWLVYTIYTSGSTGRPKGVQVTHRGMQNLVEVQKQHFELQSGDRILQFSSLSFDASIWEVCMSLCTGATLCLAEENKVLAGQALQEVLKEQAITVITLPPSALASLPVEDMPQLRTLIVAGEACPAELMAQWAKGRRFFNAYGPTETTVCATLERCSEERAEISLGRPIQNTEVYILDAFMQPVPIGVPGELYIGGNSLASDYLNRPELTAERFVPHPFAGRQSARLYKTGDRVRYQADGKIEFLGRIDHQVKIRGYRIEPGEIEAALLRHPAVRACAVVVREKNAEDKQLVAYVTLREGMTLASGEARAFLQQRLPEYMLPAFILPLAEMPLMPNGKIDRGRLPDVESLRRQAEPAPTVLSTTTEQVIAAIWQECLHLEKVGRNENFFELGAQSLLVVQVLQKLREHFQRDIELTDLFEYPTVSALSRYLDQTELPERPPHEQTSTPQTRQEEALKAGRDRLKRKRLVAGERTE